MFDAFNLYLKRNIPYIWVFFYIFTESFYFKGDQNSKKKNGHDYYHFKSDRFKAQVFY